MGGYCFRATIIRVSHTNQWFQLPIFIGWGRWGAHQSTMGTCELCGKAVSDVGRHLKEVHGPPATCSLCGHTYSRLSGHPCKRNIEKALKRSTTCVEISSRCTMGGGVLGDITNSAARRRVATRKLNSRVDRRSVSDPGVVQPRAEDRRLSSASLWKEVDCSFLLWSSIEEEDGVPDSPPPVCPTEEVLPPTECPSECPTEDVLPPTECPSECPTKVLPSTDCSTERPQQQQPLIVSDESLEALAWLWDTTP